VRVHIGPSLLRKSGLCLLAALLLSLSGCALFPRRAALIDWPGRVEYLQAFGELDIRWKDLKYSGTMSLTLNYPGTFNLEVYGPFGETGLYIRKDEKGFLLVSGDERITDQQVFEKKFHISIHDLMNDISMSGQQDQTKADGVSLNRGIYTVTYDLSNGRNRICWRSDEGTICIRFLEASFQKE
jgi:hypothetical protein